MTRMLSGADIRALAKTLNTRPTKSWGQNFVTDPNTVRRIARLAEVASEDLVVEVGPGLGSLTLALLETGARVSAIEIDPVLAAALPETVARNSPDSGGRLQVVLGDALQIDPARLWQDGRRPTALVANLPYNVSVPVLLHLLVAEPGLRSALVMVQREVGERLAAAPGNRTYGIPSAKAQWFGEVRLVATVPRSVFWPIPNVDSVLVRLDHRDPPAAPALREATFAVVDAAFSQRRKMLRSALAGWAGSTARATALLEAAQIAPTTRGEALGIADFARIAQAATE